MPNYRWRAIDLDGVEYTGKQWAPTVQQLEQDLLEQNIGLMSVSRIKLVWIERLSIEEQIQFFEQLHMLLGSGLLIWQALQVLARYGSRMRQLFADELQLCVKHGSSFVDALSQFNTMVDPLALCLIKSGQESGDLPHALEYLVKFLRMRADMRKKCYDAARVPLVTFAFFCAVVLIIFLAIMPSFEQVLLVTNQTSTGGLQRLFNVSRWLNSLGLFGIVGLITAFIGFCYWVNRMTFVQHIKQWCCAYVPGIAGIYWAYELSGFFQAVALLVHGGAGLAEAMQVSLVVTNNRYIKDKLIVCTRAINEGYALDQSFVNTCGKYAKPDITPLLVVGTETGMLASVLEQSARLYFDYAQQQLNRVVLFVQPLLMGLLGLFVALLLYTVYVPIIQLPQTLSSMNI